METFNDKLDTLDPELVILPEDNRNNSPSRNHHKAKQVRKASTISMSDNAKTKRRNSKHRSSLARNTHRTSDASTLTKTCNSKSNNENHLSTSEELSTKHKIKSNEVIQDFTQMKLADGQIPQYLQKNYALISIKDEKPKGSIELIVEEMPDSINEKEQPDMNIEEKFAQDHTFDIIGIMNLSSMNLTDHDIPMIIERAFHDKHKKFFGLNLRDNALTSEGVKMLVDALLKLRATVKYLCLSDNSNIGDEGIEHLTRLLRKSRTMIFLAVPNTGITDRGVRILADTLCGFDADSSCAPLEKLYISFNKSITDESLVAVLQIIEQSRTLKVLSVQHCSLSIKARQILRQVGTKMKKRRFSIAQ